MQRPLGTRKTVTNYFIMQSQRPIAGIADRVSFRRMGGLWRVAQALESEMVGINTGLISTEDSLLTARTVSGARTFGGPLR